MFSHGGRKNPSTPGLRAAAARGGRHAAGEWSVPARQGPQRPDPAGCHPGETGRLKWNERRGEEAVPGQPAHVHAKGSLQNEGSSGERAGALEQGAGRGHVPVPGGEAAGAAAPVRHADDSEAAEPAHLPGLPA